MNKILIIGQAPPAVKQEFPYDTTLLYDILGWVGISKEQAQEMFEFEAMTDKFPGHGVNGHLKPSKAEMLRYYFAVLSNKIATAKRVIVLGNVAAEALIDFGAFIEYPSHHVFYMIHPSKRNYSKIMAQKENLTKTLDKFINH